MTPAIDSFWDILSQDEADFVQAIMLELADQSWAQPIIAGINNNGGLTRENKDRLFELRFAYALHRASIPPTTRYRAKRDPRSILGFPRRAGDGPWSCYGSAKRRRSRR